MTRFSLFFSLVVLAGALACAGSKTTSTTDNGTPDHLGTDAKTDVAGQDAKADIIPTVDLGQPEAGAEVDAADAAPTDTAPTDTAPTDTAPTDTSPIDTAPTDTAPTDTVAADQAGTEVVDDTAVTDTTATDVAATDTTDDAAEAANPPGTLTIVSSNNKLPDPWVVTDATVLKADGSGTGASAHGNQLVKLAVQTTVSNDPCPLPYTSSSGKVYCDGFNATDSSSNTVVVDIFSYLGTSPACTLPTSGTLGSITGIWQDSYDSATKIATRNIALADCSGVGLATPYAGTATPAASTDIQTLDAALPTGTQVTVSGVVVATWTATTAWGFTMMDPGGGDNSGMAAEKGPSSTSSASQPQVGDYVTVTGSMKHMGLVLMRIDI